MSNPNAPVLKPQELFAKRKTRDSSRLKAYNQILEQIHARILTQSRTGTDAFLLYTVPPFILGLPRLDLQDCIIYIVYQLRQQAYEVRYTYPNLLFISWHHHEKEYLQKQSPLIKAMMPTQVEKKEQISRVRFADEIRGPSGIQPKSQATALPSAVRLSPPKSVADYKPPVSFLDALERPVNPQPTKKDVLNDLWNF
jgi:hypothetical protein